MKILLATGKIQGNATIREVNEDTVMSFVIFETNGLHAEKERKSWIKCSLWRPDPNLLDTLKDGVFVRIEGIPIAEAYKGQDGEPKASLKCTISAIHVECQPVNEASEPTETPRATKKSDKGKSEIITNQSIEDERIQRESEQAEDDLPF